MIGRKIYYELETGDVILTTLEKSSESAINTTKEQDFQIYDVLQARDINSIGIIQLEFGQYQGEFQSANSCKVNLETKDLMFEYPIYAPPLTEKIKVLENANDNLKLENATLKEQQVILEKSLLETQNAINGLLGV